LTSSWTNQRNLLSLREVAHVNAKLLLDSSFHTIGLLCCFLLVSFQLTSLIGYGIWALYLIGQIKCYLSVLFSCKILYTLSICKCRKTKGKKDTMTKSNKKEINKKKERKKRKRMKKRRVLENEKGSKLEKKLNSFRCYVLYFLYIKRESTKNYA